MNEPKYVKQKELWNREKAEEKSSESGMDIFSPTEKQLRYIRYLGRLLGVKTKVDEIKTKTSASRIISALKDLQQQRTGWRSAK